MIHPMGRPARISCGRCGASAALEWVSLGDGDWSGLGQCPACGAGVLSIFSESGIHLDDLAALLRDFSDAEDASAKVVFGGVEPPQKGGSAALIA